jgi:hypothetical protein
MEHLTTVKSLLKQGHFMTKLHLKDAYLSVAIHPQSKKILGFLWQNKAYQFRSLPFGLNIAPSMFTRLMKPVAGFLRKWGIRLVRYTGEPSIHSDSHESTGISGFYNKQREVGTIPNWDNHISWLYDHFHHNALHLPSKKKKDR